MAVIDEACEHDIVDWLDTAHVRPGVVVELDALNTPCSVPVDQVVRNAVADIHQRRCAPAVVHEVYAQGLVIDNVPLVLALLDDEVHEPEITKATVEVLHGGNITRAGGRIGDLGGGEGTYPVFACGAAPCKRNEHYRKYRN